MLFQWSKKRKILEDDLLCDGLKGRVRYFCTRYHGAPDEVGRMAILVDGEERLVISDEIDSRIDAEYYGRSHRSFCEIQTQYNDQGQFGSFSFQNAILIFLETPIEESLRSSDPLLNLFAILDRRVGKRRLQKLRGGLISGELPPVPDWLRFFYDLRLEAEGMEKLPVPSPVDKAHFGNTV
ncbi:MAG: hypothetical protein IJX47_08105 [Clostridia bacterium]|nr:hypothetical protein [Clostridia bacterium]